MKTPLCTLPVLFSILAILVNIINWKGASPSHIFYTITGIVLIMSVLAFAKFRLFNKLFIRLFHVLLLTMGDSKSERENNLDNLSPRDAILILLYANKNKPITGKLMFVKQAFLLSKEIIPTLDKKFNFYPANFGPYSKVFAREVNNLVNEGVIDLEYREEDTHEIYRFKLDKEEIEKAKKAFNKLPDRLKFKIMRKRKGWDQLGYTGIVRLVYTKYPEYAVNSEIRGEINGN